jgi:hypothetical protein
VKRGCLRKLLLTVFPKKSTALIITQTETHISFRVHINSINHIITRIIARSVTGKITGVQAMPGQRH